MSNNIVFIGLDVEDNSFHGSALDPLTDETIQYRTHPTLKGILNQMLKQKNYFRTSY